MVIGITDKSTFWFVLRAPMSLIAYLLFLSAHHINSYLYYRKLGGCIYMYIIVYYIDDYYLIVTLHTPVVLNVYGE